MRTTVLFLCLALVRDNSASILQSYDTNMERLTLEEQIKIHQYEQNILEMLLKKHKTFSSQDINKHTTISSKKVIQQRKHNIAPGSQDFLTTGEFLIAIQEILSSGIDSIQKTKDPEHIFEDAFEITRHVDEKDKRSIHAAFVEHNNITWKNATQLIEENDYRVETHSVKTKDGYLITLFHIMPHRQDSEEVSERTVVLLVHGLLGSATDWLLMGPQKSLAYQMTDAGFDVWLGNLRGSKYSQRHVSKHHALPDFWDFSIDEIAAQDLPTMIDYTLKVTRKSKLHYVGHSLGATAFFCMASAYPAHAKKVTMMYALSPMVYMNHVRSPLLRMASPKSRYFRTIYKQLVYGEFKPNKYFMRIIGGKMYENVIGSKQVASNLKYVVSGVATSGMDRNLMPIIIKHLPAGASARQIKHYGQAKAAGQLRKYDYGEKLNRQVYGQPRPPIYNMTQVHVPVAIYFSEDDLLAHPEDVEKLHSELPNVTDYYMVPERHFSHMDFQFSKSAPVTINKRLIDSIKRTI